MYRIGEKSLKRGNLVYVGASQTILEFDSKGTCFPDRNTGSTYFSWGSVEGNNMYIDFDDGTGIHKYAPNLNGTSFQWVGEVIHYYQDLADPSKIGTVDASYSQSRIVKVWFDYPQKVTDCLLQSFNMYGDFPKNIGNYSLATMRFSGISKLASFPVKFRGGVFTSVYLTSISPNKLTDFPRWIGSSKITNLTLNSVFDFSGGASSTNIERITGCQGLNLLNLNDNSITKNEDLPTLKNIPTLRQLIIGRSSFSTLPKKITDCNQVENLDLSGASYLTNWGEGLGSMTELSTLSYVISYSAFAVQNTPSVLTRNLPAGLENCVKLKSVIFRYTFRYLDENDIHISNWYDFIKANATRQEGNTKFRNMSFDAGISLNASAPLRPSGGATPTSIVEPPTSPIQKVYNLCKIYGHTWRVRNFENTGLEIIT